MGDENPRRTLGDYSRPSHEGYRNTIEVPNGNDLVPLRSDTIRLVQNGCSFHGLRSEDPNQHLKDFLKIVDSIDLNVETRERTRLRLFQFSLRDQASNWLERLPAGSISTWEDLTTRFLAQFFPPGRTSKLRNDILMFQQHQAVGGKLHDKSDKNNEDSWALLEDLALYDNESWNDPRDFAKPVKAISMPHDVPSASDRRLIELENQVQRMMEAHLSQSKPVQVNKITSSMKQKISGTLLKQRKTTLIIMVNVIPPDYVDDVPVVEPNQHDDVPVVPESVLEDEDEDPEEEEFEEEEEPQEEEDDMDVDIEEDENQPELTYPYEKVDPLNPPPPASESEPEDAIEVENPIEHEDETVPANVNEVGESSTVPFC
ncbi:MAK10-like protein [Tanacetum coccineum]